MSSLSGSIRRLLMLIPGPGGWEKFCLSKVLQETIRLPLYFKSPILILVRFVLLMLIRFRKYWFQWVSLMLVFDLILYKSRESMKSFVDENFLWLRFVVDCLVFFGCIHSQGCLKCLSEILIFSNLTDFRLPDRAFLWCVHCICGINNRLKDHPFVCRLQESEN